MISDATKRSIFRWVHLVFGIAVVGYVYSPFEEIPNYGLAPFSRTVRKGSISLVWIQS